MPDARYFAVKLKAVAVMLMAGAAVVALQVPHATAQGWSDDGDYDDEPRWRSGRNLEVYPDGYSDADIEDAQRRRYSRPYWPQQRRWNDRFEDDDDDEYFDERRAPQFRGRRDAPSRNAMRSDGDAGRQQPAKPAAPTTGKFAPGPRPAIRPEAPPIVAFTAKYPAGSVVIDTSARRLYFVRGRNSAFAYPIGVGRDGFAWSGSENVSRIADWPDWYPPAEMRKRQPYLPERMLGGLNNPLGAKAIYLGNTLYRIHGTNDPSSIGRAKSSGCFRMMNQHVAHLASLVNVGTQVTVVRALGRGLKIVNAPGRRVTARNDRQIEPRRPLRDRWQRDSDPYPYDDRDYYFDDGR